MLAIGYWGGCTLYVYAMSYLVHYVCWDYMQDFMEYTFVFTVWKHLACSLAICLYCNVLPFTKNAEVPSAAICQLTSADHGIASQWTTVAKLDVIARKWPAGQFLPGDPFFLALCGLQG